MAAQSRHRTVARTTFLLDRAKKRPERFSALHPQTIATLAELRNSLAHATKDSLWISYEKDLTEALLRNLSWPARPLGVAVLAHATDPQTLPALASCFRRFAFSVSGRFLPPDELAEALAADNRSDLFIGGSVDPASQTLTLWRGTLDPLTVPFAAFDTSGDGIEPNFQCFSVTDCGQTIRLGDYEAAADAVLYEFDPDYRRRISKERRQSERSFGAAVRRLRHQRGLRREDFAPEVAAKTVARIEQGQVRRIQKKTLAALAKHLRVRPEEIADY